MLRFTELSDSLLLMILLAKIRLHARQGQPLGGAPNCEAGDKQNCCFPVKYLSNP
jgi:hypothetical protein